MPNITTRAPDDYGPAMRMLIALGRAPPEGAYEALEAARRGYAAAMAAAARRRPT